MKVPGNNRLGQDPSSQLPCGAHAALPAAQGLRGGLGAGSWGAKTRPLQPRARGKRRWTSAQAGYVPAAHQRPRLRRTRCKLRKKPRTLEQPDSRPGRRPRAAGRPGSPHKQGTERTGRERKSDPSALPRCACARERNSARAVGGHRAGAGLGRGRAGAVGSWGGGAAQALWAGAAGGGGGEWSSRAAWRGRAVLPSAGCSPAHLGASVAVRGVPSASGRSRCPAAPGTGRRTRGRPPGDGGLRSPGAQSPEAGPGGAGPPDIEGAL